MPGNFNGIYSSVSYQIGLIWNDLEATPFNDIVDQQLYGRGPESIVGITMFPKGIIDNAENGSGITDHPAPYILHRSVARPSYLGGDNQTGYRPKNNKLYTSQFLFLCVDTLNAVKNYSYELFTAPALAHFKIIGLLQPNPEIGIIPENYNGIAENYTENVVMEGFPQCACVIDSYRAWLAQKASGQILGLLGSAATMGVGIATGGLGLVAGVSGGIGIAQTLNQMHLDQTYGSRARGSQGGSVDVAARGKAIYFKAMSITRQYAERIDGFFDKYGYAQDSFAVPNRTARPSYTYIKTKECNIKSANGGVPADSLKKIKEIYNKGITFWQSLNNVGDYTQENRVPGTY